MMQVHENDLFDLYSSSDLTRPACGTLTLSLSVSKPGAGDLDPVVDVPVESCTYYADPWK